MRWDEPKQPLDPVYMAYIYNTPEPASYVPYSTGTSKPYQPATQLSQDYINNQFMRGVYEHFHRPYNDHNRFLSSATKDERDALRVVERLAPHPWDKTIGQSTKRPSSAPASGRPVHTQALQVPSIIDSLAAHTTTSSGVPVHSAPIVLEADLQDGSPLPFGFEGQEAWRVAKVQAYAVPPSPVGYAEGGQRPFHQDYRHYKYYGFAGRGAKTSWAHNPKYNPVHAEKFLDATHKGPQSCGGAPPPPPLQDTIGGPRRPLTPGEKKLVKQFRDHSYAADTSGHHQARRSVSPARAAMASSLTTSKTGLKHAVPPPTPPLPPAEIIEPYLETVDIIHCQPVPRKGQQCAPVDKARVATYRQPAPGGYTLAINPSPNHGSQSPFHQRYSHYKYNGFAGKGAASSWARNPKHALLYDH